MIIDSSALVAILLEEPEALRLTTAISRSAIRLLPASCLLETSTILLGRRGTQGTYDLDLYAHRARMELVPFSEPQAQIARVAFARYGKGRHPAGLNFGDCMAYGAAKETGEELLFKGTAFAQTDIAVAAY
jgi:ribonuclease VapC